MGVKIIWTCGILMLFLKGCFNGTVRDNHVELLGRVEVWKGSCAMLPCKYKPKEPFDKFIWYYNATYDIINREFNGTTVYNSKDENDTDPSFAGRVQYVGKSNTDCTIVIRNIQKEDEGTYNLRLLSKNKDFKWMSKTLTMVVSDIGTTLKIEPLPEIRESENVTLTCSISYYCPFNNISLYWIEDVNGTSTIDIRSDTSEVRTTSTLMFRPSWRDNEKNITCVLNGDDGESDNTTVQLNVMYAPRCPMVVLELNSTTFSEEDKVIFVEGDKVLFRCNVTSSNPDVNDIIWYKNGNKIKKCSEPVKAEDAGNYTCEAENSVGRTISLEVNVDVHYAPRCPMVVLELNRTTSSEEDQIIFVEGDKVLFRCNVNSSKPDVTNIIWYKNGKSIQKNCSQPIKAEDAGNYTCEAENSVGRTMSPEVTVDVHYAPRCPMVVLALNSTIYSEEDQIIFVEGDKVLFRCNVTSSNPDVTNIIWYKNGNEIHKFSESIKAEDAGNYTCEAENSVGRTMSPEVNVDVHYAPRYPMVVLELDRTFAEEDQIIFVEGDKVIFRCNVTSSNPEVTDIIWYKDGENIQRNCESLKVEDAGSYSCEAENSVGRTMSPEVMVDVHYAPKNVTLTVTPGDHVTEHMDVTLKCTGKGKSTPISYEFYLNNVSLSADNDSFELKNVQIKDSGEYSCLAINSVGERRSNVVFLHVSNSPATIGKFASLGTFSFIILLMLIILTVRFRVRIRNALCRRTVGDKSESSSFVLKKYENITSSERAHEDSRNGTSDTVSANLNEKVKEQERDPEVEYASLGHS